MIEPLITRYKKSIAERKRDEVIDMKMAKDRSDIEFIAMMADVDIYDDDEGGEENESE